MHKKKYLILSSIISFVCLVTYSSAAPSQGPTNPSPNQNQSNDNNISVSPTISPITNIYVAQEVVSSLSNYVSRVGNSIATSIQNTTNTLKTTISVTIQYLVDTSKANVNSLAEYVRTNKLKLSIYALIGSYAYLHYKLLMIQYALSKDTNWSLWSTISVPLEELFVLPQKQLGEIIIKEAQRRYTIIERPDDFVTPLVTFVRDVDEEHALLQTYMTLCTWIRRLHLSKITWISTALEAECKERLQRLAYIKNLFLTWIAEHKFAQYAPAGV